MSCPASSPVTRLRERGRRRAMGSEGTTSSTLKISGRPGRSHYEAALVRGPVRSDSGRRSKGSRRSAKRHHNTERLRGSFRAVSTVEFQNALFAIPNDHNLPVGIK